MEMYLGVNQEQIIATVNEFIANNKTIIVDDSDYSKALLFQKVNETISAYLKEKTGLNIEVHQYFDGKKLSKTKMEVVDRDKNISTGVYVSLKRKRISKEDVKVSEPTESIMKQWINGKQMDITVRYAGIAEVEKWMYTLSSSYDYLVLS